MNTVTPPEPINDTQALRDKIKAAIETLLNPNRGICPTYRETQARDFLCDVGRAVADNYDHTVIERVAAEVKRWDAIDVGQHQQTGR